MRTWVCLSRYGDLMNLMPIWFRDAQIPGAPAFNAPSKVVVSAEYASLFDGISYADPIIFNGPTHEIQKAVDFAKTLGGEVVCPMFNGPREQIDAVVRTQKPGQATSYEKDAWRVTGNLKFWDDCLPLVFDHRDAQREEKLLREHDLIKRGKQKPLMLLSLNGNASPFPYADLLRELVALKFGNDWRILELPQAERIYDLLAIYERASLLIAADSAPLHLAWACRKLPVFALTQDRPTLWHGSSWRPTHLWYCRYHDWPERAVEMCQMIENLQLSQESTFTLQVWSEYQTARKIAPASCWLPVHRGLCGRDSANTLQDEKRHPYLKDVLRMAIQRASLDLTNIVLRRPDVTICDSLCPPHEPPFFSYRLTRNGDGDRFAPIADLFCATKKWWKELLPEIPDFVLNNDHYWSEGLRVLFQQRGATDATGCCSFVKGEK